MTFVAERLPPPVPGNAAIAALIAARVDVHHLSRGMVVGVTDGGAHRTVAHGFADAARDRPVGADTLFEIGLVTKLFTALADPAPERSRPLRRADCVINAGRNVGATPV